MNIPWKLILLLTGIFLAGVVTGGIATPRIIRKEIAKRFAPEQWCPNRLALLTKHLELTPEQQAKLRPIVQRDRDDLIRTRDNTVKETRRIIERMEHDIAEVLTPAQQVKFEKFNQERRIKVRRYFRGWFSGKEQEEKDCPPDAPKAEQPTKSAGGN